MSETEPSLGQLRVVVVDDDALVLAVTRRVLMRAGYAVAVFEDVERALTDVSEQPPFAVVADLHMPQMSGAELLRRVAAAAPETFRLLYTGEVEQSEMERALTPGLAHAVVPKAAGVRLLPDALEQLRRPPA